MMFSEKLKIEQPFITKFFEASLKPKNGKFSHAYMFTGNDPLAQYNLAVQIAKILNCSNRYPEIVSGSKPHEILNQVQNDGVCEQGDETECSCTNCKWIKENRHPAVITVSHIDYLYGNDKEKAKEVISVDQARYLRQALLIASQYHRVIIFTDAVEGKEYEKKASELWKNYRDYISPPFLDIAEEDRISWIPQPLTRKNFHSDAANTLLKTIEEPPPNVTFFFLTKDSEDMLQTIVSRTQVLPVVANNHEVVDLSILENFFKVFPPKNSYEAIKYPERLLELAKENSCAEEDLLIMLQEYMRKLLKENAENKVLSEKIIKNITRIELAQKEIANHVSVQAVFDSLMLSFTV